MYPTSIQLLLKPLFYGYGCRARRSGQSATREPGGRVKIPVRERERSIAGQEQRQPKLQPTQASSQFSSHCSRPPSAKRWGKDPGSESLNHLKLCGLSAAQMSPSQVTKPKELFQHLWNGSCSAYSREWSSRQPQHLILADYSKVRLCCRFPKQ